MAYDKYIVYFISRTKQRMINFIQKNLIEEEIYDIVPTYGNVLTALFESENLLTMQQLSEKIGKDKSTVTHLVNKLASLDYVTKKQSQNDRRVTHVVLTEKSYQTKPKFDLITARVYETAYKDFTQEEKETFLRLLRKLNQNFKI